jgi:Zn finger protein HypA/HybF involved in hydrogenase expression
VLAKFKCWKCGHKFEAKPGPIECPECKHNYLTWINFDRMVPGTGLPLPDVEKDSKA